MHDHELSEQPDVFTVIYNSSLETAPIIGGENVGENATMQNDDDFFQGFGVQPNCTEISSLHLMEIFARTDIGNQTEIWGSVSDAWLAHRSYTLGVLHRILCHVLHSPVDYSVQLCLFFKTSSFTRMHHYHTDFICSVVLFQLRASRVTDEQHCKW